MIINSSLCRLMLVALIPLLLGAATDPSEDREKVTIPPELDIPNAPIAPVPENKVFYRVVLDPLYRTLLYAEVNRPVERIYFRMGDSFQKGDILIQLDSIVFQANRLKAEAMLEKARTEYAAKQQLFRDNVASLFELKEAQAAVADAEAELALANNNLDASMIKAPYDGKVVDLSIEEHELPKNGSELIEIVNDHILLARLLIPSNLLRQIHIGDPLVITIHETGERVIGYISRIGAVIDPSSSTIKIEAQIDNRSGQWRAGMTGSAELSKPEEEERR